MQRSAFKMKLKPGCEAEYQKRHNEIWPELVKMLKDSGVYDYSIFWDKETNILFAVQKIEGEQTSQDLGPTPIVRNGGIIWPIHGDQSDNSARFDSAPERFTWRKNIQ